MLRRLVSPTKTRARIYDRDGVLILDSRNLYGRGDVLRFDLPPPDAEQPGLMERAFIAMRRWFGRGDLPLYKELGPENGKGYPEVAAGARRPARQHGAGQRPRRGDRLGRGAGAALPRRARRADAVDARRRHRRHGGGRAARHRQGVPGRRQRHGGALDAARRHHRRPGAPARRRRRARAPAYPQPRRDPRFHPPARRDRRICRARCAK